MLRITEVFDFICLTIESLMISDVGLRVCSEGLCQGDVVTARGVNSCPICVSLCWTRNDGVHGPLSFVDLVKCGNSSSQIYNLISQTDAADAAGWRGESLSDSDTDHTSGPTVEIRLQFAVYRSS